MLTALLAVENMLGAGHDLWQVNADDEYHEQAQSGRETGTGRSAPVTLARPANEGRAA